MYRVLSDEESQKVTRWKAPDLDAKNSEIANTRQQYRPDQLLSEKDVLPLLGSALLKPSRARIKSASPNLQLLKTTDVLRNSGFDHSASGSATDGINKTEQIERIPVEVMQAKYDEGYAKGLADSKSALLDHSIKELRQLITAIGEASKHNAASGLEETLLSFSLDIAAVVIRRELTVDQSLMLELIKVGIEQLPVNDESQKYVNLHPEDANIIRKLASSEDRIAIVEDPTLNRGDCRIESGASVVDAGIKDWLHQVAVQLGLLPELRSDEINDVGDKLPSTDISGSSVNK